MTIACVPEHARGERGLGRTGQQIFGRASDALLVRLFGGSRRSAEEGGKMRQHHGTT
jgi:hypothetical protein